MKDIIKKFISGRGKTLSITNEEVNEFINESFYLFRQKYPSDEDLYKIQMAFQFGYFSIESTIENIIRNSNKLGFVVNTLIDKNGKIINTTIS